MILADSVFRETIVQALRLCGHSEEEAAHGADIVIAQLNMAIKGGRASSTAEFDSLVRYAIVSARREAVRYARRERRAHALVRGIDDIASLGASSEPGPLERILDAEELRVALKALESLDPQLRDPIVEHYFFGRTHKQAAAELGMADAVAFGNWLHKHALPALRAALPQEYKTRIARHLVIKPPPERGDTENTPDAA